MAKRSYAGKQTGTRNSARRPGRRHEEDDAPPPRRKAAWPFVLVMLLAWVAIFGAIFYSNFVSKPARRQKPDGHRAVARCHHPGRPGPADRSPRPDARGAWWRWKNCPRM